MFVCNLQTKYFQSGVCVCVTYRRNISRVVVCVTYRQNTSWVVVCVTYRRNISRVVCVCNLQTKYFMSGCVCETYRRNISREVLVCVTYRRNTSWVVVCCWDIEEQSSWSMCFQCYRVHKDPVYKSCTADDYCYQTHSMKRSWTGCTSSSPLTWYCLHHWIKIKVKSMFSWNAG